MENKNIIIKPLISYAFLKPLGIMVFTLLLSLGVFEIIDYLQRTDLIWATFQVNTLYPYFIGLFLFALIIYSYKVAFILSLTYKIDNEQIEFKRGVFSISTDFIELYRVKDLTIRKPFILRLITGMNLDLITSDKTHPLFKMVAIPKSNIHTVLRELVERNRTRKGVYEID